MARDFVFNQGARVITQMSPGWARSELYAGGLHVATYTNSTTYFDHSDWLGTVRVRSSVSGATVESCSSLSFGDSLSCTGTDPSPLHFTGSDLDSESGLTHTLFRQLSTVEGRWTAPDPAGMGAVSMADPQTWNRYAYVGNMPLTEVDPLGLARWHADAGPISLGECRLDGVIVPCAQLQSALGFGNGGVNSFSMSAFFFNAYKTMSDGPMIGGPPGASATLGYYAVGGCPAGVSGDLCAGTDLLPEILTVTWPVANTGDAANNGNWLQKGLDYLKNHPVFISVNEIVAGQVTVQWSTKTVCGNLGAGASVPPSKAVTVGVYNNGNMSNWTNVLSSWGYSFGANLIAGYAMSTNSSGTIGGPSISGVGLSGSYTYGGCMTIP